MNSFTIHTKLYGINHKLIVPLKEKKL